MVFRLVFVYAWFSPAMGMHLQALKSVFSVHTDSCSFFFFLHIGYSIIQYDASNTSMLDFMYTVNFCMLV